MPEEVSRSLWLTSRALEPSDQRRALGRAKYEGWLAAIPVLADKAAAALAHRDHKALTDRLTLLGMMMLRNAAPDVQRALLHEYARMLSDLPHGLLMDAIDECVKAPGCTFIPSIADIRAKIASPLQQAETEAVNLRRLAVAIEEGADIPEYAPPPRFTLNPEPEPEKKICTPEEARAIMAEFNIAGAGADRLAAMLDADQPKTRAEMIAEGKMPPPINPRPDDIITV